MLNITSASRRQGDMKAIVYQVADLVTPLAPATSPTSVLQNGTVMAPGDSTQWDSEDWSASVDSNPLMANSRPRTEGQQPAFRTMTSGLVRPDH